MYPILAFGSRRAEGALAAAARAGRGDRLLRPDRARPRLGPGRDGDAGGARRQRLGAQRHARCGSRTASLADVAIVWAKTARSTSARSAASSSRPSAPGFSATDQKGKLSLLASDTSEIVLRDVRVPAENLLPGAAGLKSPLKCLNQARYGIAWGAVGAAMACYDEALRLRQEPHSVRAGRSPAFQLQQLQLVDMLDRDHQGAAALPAARPAEGRGTGDARPDLARQAQQRATWPATSRARRAGCSAPTGSSSSTSRCGTWQPRVGQHLRGHARHPHPDPRRGDHRDQRFRLMAGSPLPPGTTDLPRRGVLCPDLGRVEGRRPGRGMIRALLERPPQQRTWSA